ncbi:uncharacterized protein LOC135079896 isoform X2 [Ostrinia nubilalis]|uniref:uncharacterized protein LOC135079896 isoform X2 n=1 Tax=Ostrinia nubilalis TaxID=29057 RepID=UPI0030825EF2
MSDSESDLLPNNVFTFQNENTTVCARGPNINNANITNLSFRNNVMTSTMHMSRNFGRQRYGEPSFDQRSMYSRRETSPMSMYSGSDMRGRNQSYYHGGMSSQRSMYNGRSGSPMSMRSLDSNATVSAVDIALAIKNNNFNINDLKLIKEAYDKFMKKRIRKKIEKRRNIKLFLKGYRRKSGYDSGELGSDSSISSDDCKSTASAMYRDNMSSCRSTRTDMTDFRKKINESNMYKDCTDNFKQNAMKKMFSVPSVNARDRFNTSNALPTMQNLPGPTQRDRFNTSNACPSMQNLPGPTQKDKYNTSNALPSMQNLPIQTQKDRFNTSNVQSTMHNQLTQRDRFKNGFLLPSQRFNKSVASIPIPERDKSQGKPKNHTSNKYNTQENNETDSDHEEIFKKANGTIIKEPNVQVLVNEDNVSEAQKNNNDFEFIKPQLPVKKAGPGKIKEKLISKSAPPLTDAILPLSVPQTEPTDEEKQVTAEEQPNTTQHSTSDVSMRPSFIKRKLFSQKMDVTERKNMSNDAINVNSPQTNVYSAIQQEKHKARKLVTNQSCLSRDVAKEDNNLLDLIHKIVPPDRMNATNVTNTTSISSIGSKNQQLDEDDKWDVTSVISTCNNDDVSDTYTDEEIFATDENKQEPKAKTIKNNVINSKKINDCKVLVEKMPKNIMASAIPDVEVNKALVPEDNDKHKKSVYNCVKSFWDADFESDIETSMPKQRISAVKENHIAAKENLAQSKSIITEANKTVKNQNPLNISLVSVSGSIKSKTMPTNNMGKLKFNVSKNLSIRSFLSPKDKKTKLKEQKIEVNPKTLDYKSPNVEPEVKNTKKSNKQSTTTKTKSKDTNSKKEVKKPNKSIDTAKNNKTAPSPDKTKNNKTTSKTNKKPTPVKSKQNNKVTQSVNKNIKKPVLSPNKTKNNNKKTQSPNEIKNKENNQQSSNSTDKTVANRSISSRSIRTPKRKACCDDAVEHDKSTKSNGNPSKKPKLVESIPDKSKPTKNISDNKKNVSRKKAQPVADLSLIYENESPNMTLRSKRRVDLSSSINSSTELATLKLRNLRTRRVDLSSSLKNSSLDDNVTIIKNSRTKTQVKKSTAKPSHAELLDKRQRR